MPGLCRKNDCIHHCDLSFQEVTSNRPRRCMPIVLVTVQDRTWYHSCVEFLLVSTDSLLLSEMVESCNMLAQESLLATPILDPTLNNK